jgi:hypothetical protein
VRALGQRQPDVLRRIGGKTQLAILDSNWHSSDLLAMDEDDKLRRAKALIDRFISGERR